MSPCCMARVEYGQSMDFFVSTFSFFNVAMDNHHCEEVNHHFIIYLNGPVSTAMLSNLPGISCSRDSDLQTPTHPSPFLRMPGAKPLKLFRMVAGSSPAEDFASRHSEM